MRRGNPLNHAGNVATEFVLVLPFAMLLIITVLGMAVLGVRAVAVQTAAMQAARKAATFQEDEAIHEFDRNLPENIFAGGAIDVRTTDGSARSSNEEEGVIEARALSNGALDLFSASIVRRQSPVAPALRAGLGERALGGGDTPSPYCAGEGGYEVCGFAE